jgi:ADP-heptose:LPS heptosyltransferase
MREPRQRGGVRGLFSLVTVLKILDATAGSALCWGLGLARHVLSRRHPSRELRREAVRRVLVIRPGGMGDMILLLPALHRLRALLPDASVEVIGERRNAAVLRLAGWTPACLTYDGAPLRLLWELLTKRYDVAIDAEQFHHFSAVLAFLSGARIRIGFKINPSRNLLYTHLIHYAVDGHEGGQFMELLAPLGGADRACRLEGILAATDFDPPAGARERLAGIRRRGPLVAIAPGTPSPYKRWAAGRFADLIEALKRRWGLETVLVGGRDARPLARWLAARAESVGNRATVLAGRASLAETAAVLREARLYIGTDSGLAHLAVAVGTPTVVVFGPSDPVKWGHADARHAVVRKPLACSPCSVFGYHKLCRTLACMDGVTVDDVLAACERLLGPAPS